MSNEKKLNALNEEELFDVVGGTGGDDMYESYPCSKCDIDEGCKGCVCFSVQPFLEYSEMVGTCNKLHKSRKIRKDGTME